VNEIEALLEKPVFQALGWALFHFLWQGALVGLGMLATNVALKKRAAETRYAAACVALVLLLVLPVVTFWVVLSSTPEAAGRVAAAVEVGGAQERTRAEYYVAEPVVVAGDESRDVEAAEPPITLAALISSARSRFASLLPWMISIWLLGVLVLSGRFIGGLVVAERLKRAQNGPIPRHWQVRFSDIARRLHVARPVRLCQSALVQVPTVIGWLRPVVLLPASALTGLSPEQLEALLAHELAHIRRHDYLVNILQTAAETLLFYHPAVWWVSGQARVERENCCDDLAVRACGDVLIYARALAELESIRHGAPEMAMAASGGSLIRRIERLIGMKPSISRHRFAPSLAALGVLVMVPILMAGAGGAMARHSTGADAAVSSINAGSVNRGSSVAVDAGVPGQGSQNEAEGDQVVLEVNATAPSVEGTTAMEPDEPAAATSNRVSTAGSDGGAQSQDARSYVDEMVAAGLKNLSVEDLVRLKTAGVTADYIRALKQAGLDDLSIRRIAELSLQRVTPDYIKEMSDSGYPKLSARDLISLKIQGVTAEYIKSMVSLYPDLSIRMIIEMKIQGVDPDYVRDIASAGYDHLSARDIVSLKIQGVTPAYIKEMKSIGLDDLSARNVVGLKVQGVTPEYIREMQSIGADGKSSRELISMKVAGLTPEYVRAMRDAGLGTLTVRDLISMGIQGVTPDYVKQMKAAGLDNLSARQVIEMRIQGVDADYVKALKSAGYPNLSVREVIEFKIYGIDPQFIRRMQEHGFKNLTARQVIQLKLAGID
jgi:beta-lactamase regulating signal transducer with metallopeptidase domain